MINALLWIIGILFSLFGLEKFKNGRQKKTIGKQKQVIEHGVKQQEIYKKLVDVQIESREKMKEIDQVQETVKQSLEEAVTDENTIQIANDIIANFNRGSRN